ncbi:MAG: alginate O-acetyltransferase AlgX-related protein [Candidatus Sumerlaeota bacterium]
MTEEMNKKSKEKEKKGKAKRLTREEMALIEVGHTDVNPSVKWAVVILFLVLIALPAAVEIVHFLRGGNENAGQLPYAFTVFESIPQAAATGFKEESAESDASLPGRLWDATFRSNAAALRAINQYEDSLSEQSLLASVIRTPTQAFLIKALGSGNEQVYLGRGDWLFYRPGFDSLTGPPFLHEKQLAKRRAMGSEYIQPPQPDPREAVLQFHRQLSERGIQLVLLPTPVKPVVHPEKYDRNAANLQAPVHNASFETFKRQVREAGVLVLDPAPELFLRGRTKTQYLPGDTHWRPEGMEYTAAAVKQLIEEKNLLPSRRPAGYTRRETEASELGDLVTLLDVSEELDLYEPTTVTIHPVSARGSMRWQPDPNSDVLLLGDSFSNIFSLGAMNWGESAGLAEQLSFELQRPVDRIVRNSDGAYATRQILSNELARGRDRLAGKKVVVWQFASRELAVGDWKLLPMELDEAPPQTFVLPQQGESLLVEGVVLAVSNIPQPGSVPYSDHIFTVHLGDLRGEGLNGGQAAVYMRSMRDNELTPAARLLPGQRVEVRLQSWYDMEEELGGLNRSGPDDLILQEHAWGELAESAAISAEAPRQSRWPLWFLLAIAGFCAAVFIYHNVRRKP